MWQLSIHYQLEQWLSLEKHSAMVEDLVLTIDLLLEKTNINIDMFID